MRLLPLLLLLGCPAATPKPADVPCGDALTCTDGAVCIVHPQEEPCTTLEDTGAECPEGTRQTKCGGIGYPCCCGEAPAPIYECDSPSGCGGPPSCDCIDRCDGGSQCTEPADGDGTTFVCELLLPA